MLDTGPLAGAVLNAVTDAAARPDPGSDDLGPLLARTALGDRAAFAALYRRTSARAFGVVLRIVSDRAQAEEVLQETYVKVWRAAAGFDAARSQPLTWLLSIARHGAIDALRRRRAEPATVSGHGDDEGGDDEGLLQRLPSDEPGPLELLRRASEAAQLERCMGALSGSQRTSLALAYYQGLSHQEVAQSMREPLGSVKSWVRRGLLSLRACLDRVAGLPARAGATGGH
ncbi:MAG: sigma-70 family RNA polymerase sigma factor [Burkholderiales bacterium]|nr:sigma-70 family RNA polymerase sigma factor [Burkholderiales bacterium]